MKPFLKSLGPLLVLVSSLLLILEDQHRLQPWLVQFLWISLFFLFASRVSVPRLVLILTVTIYLGSAISKFNLLFPVQHGNLMLAGIDSLAGTSLRTLSEEKKLLVCQLFPLGELAIALLLIFPKTRRFGALLSIAMHSLLAAMFSPLGLNHELGVIVWNVYFVLQAMILWCRNPKAGEKKAASMRRKTMVLGTILVLFPFARLFGLLDDWLGWSLYSPREEIVRTLVSHRKVDEELSNFVSRPSTMSWQSNVLMVERWSLAAMHAPLNPSSRIEYGIALAICEKYNLWNDAAIQIEQRNLFDRQDRSSTTLSGNEEILAGANRFRINTLPGPRYFSAHTTRDDQ